MAESFHEQPILNSPYKYPARNWELDRDGQPTERIIETRRGAEFITPIPKPRKRRNQADAWARLRDLARRREASIDDRSRCEPFGIRGAMGSTHI